MMNEYTGMAEYYDLLMTSGYYDYDAQAETLATILHNKHSVMEIGVGTGLLCEKLLQKLPHLDFVGVDITTSMLQKAKERLGNDVLLHEQNVVTMNLKRTFDAIISNGGVWYMIRKKADDYVLCSHLPELHDNIEGLKQVVAHLEEDGQFIMSVQGVHTDYKQELSDGIVYCQQITPLAEDSFDKLYLFSLNGNVVAQQRCQYRLFDATETKSIMNKVGLQFDYITPCGQYHIYSKTRAAFV